MRNCTFDNIIRNNMLLFSTMTTVMHQICQYKCLVSCYIRWDYPGFCQNNEMEKDSNLPIWMAFFTTMYSLFHCFITKTSLFKYTENFTTVQWKFSDENSNIFHISAQASNEYPQSMFMSRNKTNNVYPCKPQFYYIKVGFKGFNIR